MSCAGTTSETLYSPCGIFVTINFTLYVADHANNRIQRFYYGQRNASTVAGNGASGTITLLYPTDIVLNGDGYLFIVDSGNHRIIGSGPDGFPMGCRLLRKRGSSVQSTIVAAEHELRQLRQYLGHRLFEHAYTEICLAQQFLW